MLKKVMKMDEVADFLGVKRATVWGYVRDRRLEAKKIGRSYYIYPEQMEKFLKLLKIKLDATSDAQWINEMRCDW